MKQKYSISIFMISLLLFASALCASNKANTQLKIQVKAKAETKTEATTLTKAQQLSFQQLDAEWKAMFTAPRGNSCTTKVIKPDISSDNDDSNQTDNKKSGWGLMRPNFKWIKKWGFEGASYLLDYLDPVFLQDFRDEANKIIKDLGKQDAKDNDDYSDKFNLKFVAPADNKLATDADFKSINPNWSKVIYDKSFNTNQLNHVYQEWSWYQQQDDQDPAYNFVAKFDLNGDGRLDYKETILGVIWTNKKRDGLYCYNCFFLLAKRLAAIFNYLDCESKGYLTAEDLWNKLQNLNRSETRWNIFKYGSNDSIRTLSVNDFILKNGYTIDGGVTRNEFIAGVLLGIWNRNVDSTVVLTDESRSQKNLRWSSNGMDDLVVNEFLAQNSPK